MKKLQDPCTKVRTKAGQYFLDQLYSDKYSTNRHSSSFSNCLDDIPNNLSSISQQQEEDATMSISPDIDEPDELSEDCQSPLCIPGSPSDSD